MRRLQSVTRKDSYHSVGLGAQPSAKVLQKGYAARLL